MVQILGVQKGEKGYQERAFRADPLPAGQSDWIHLPLTVRRAFMVPMERT